MLTHLELNGLQSKAQIVKGVVPHLYQCICEFKVHIIWYCDIDNNSHWGGGICTQWVFHMRKSTFCIEQPCSLWDLCVYAGTCSDYTCTETVSLLQALTSIRIWGCPRDGSTVLHWGVRVEGDSQLLPSQYPWNLGTCTLTITPQRMTVST